MDLIDFVRILELEIKGLILLEKLAVRECCYTSVLLHVALPIVI